VSGTQFDVVVAGGGPVGWACALAAQAALGTTARIAVVERDPLSVINAIDPISARVYTVASGNLAWLADQGVVLGAARSATVTAIQVFGRDGADSLHVGANDSGTTELARVVEHEALALAIAKRAQQAGVTLIAGECIALHESDATNAGTRMLELADRRLLSASVVIAADGANSRLREALALDSKRHTYPQQGVVANLTCAKPHHDTARQWFLPDGSVLALLPLPDAGQSPAVSMVWSAAVDRAANLCALSEGELLAEINAASRDALGMLDVINGTRSFPLSLLRLANPVADRFLAVGDAAHTMHPLAGQGVNVGLADARCLFALWQDVSAVHGDPGHALLLARYRRERYGPTLAMQAATDGLFRLYNLTDHPLLMAAGDAGMRLLGRLPAFRRTLSTAARQ
jgi:2-octaprenylphenol hydroxylase